jgi:C1A family cysteine protease
VSPVKNQGDCGSAEVFADVANIEGVNRVVNNVLVELSEQEIIDCAGDGCDGGQMVSPFEWLLKNTDGKIATLDSYPINPNGVGTCNLKNITVGAQISGYKLIDANEDAMAEYCAVNGPISVAIDATALQFYTDGIMTDCPSFQVDDAVAVVGYDDTNNPPYWIIKNSWGTAWGISGYALIAKGTNQCGIKTAPISAVAKKL